MPRPSAALVIVCCATLLWSSASFAQNLGGRARRPIEGAPVDVAYLTQRADLIVHGVVTGKSAAWIGRVIYTLYNVAVQETVKGGGGANVLVAVPVAVTVVVSVGVGVVPPSALSAAMPGMMARVGRLDAASSDC